MRPTRVPVQNSDVDVACWVAICVLKVSDGSTNARFYEDGTPKPTQRTRMNLTLTPIYFPVTLPIVAPVGDTAACTAVAETSLRESERRLRAFVSAAQ